MAAVTICSDFGAQENKVSHCFHCFPIYLPWSDGTECPDLCFSNVEFSIQFSRSVVSDSLRPCELQHARPSCPTPSPEAYPNSCPLSRWCHLTVSSSVVPFSSCPQSFPYQGLFKWVTSFEFQASFFCPSYLCVHQPNSLPSPPPISSMCCGLSKMNLFQ